VPNIKNYYGEVIFELTYKNKCSKPLHWLFAGFDILQKHAKEAGLRCELIKKGYHFDYLARLS
ncbi:MAG: SAM-dependent methyltransferase, partial [Candidatus Helarchaeota archaeon]